MNLSVITANYNNENYIRDCLDSILTQSYKNLEIIVFDDCSTDNSPGIIREYEKKYPGVIKAMFSPVNRGVVHARREAIHRAKGEYITTLDGDDYYFDEQKLEKEMALISHYKTTMGKDIIAYSNIVLVKGDKSLIGFQGNAKNIREGKILNDIISRTCLIPRDFVMRKEAYFEVGGYDDRFPIYEDWDLKIRLAQKYEYYYTGVNGTAYRRHGTGLSAIPLRQNLRWLKKVFKKNFILTPAAERKEIKKNFNHWVTVVKKNNRKGKKK